MLKLSICIPTYNFGLYIEQTLDSIIPNLCDGVEVVILDGGSTDNTSQIVELKQSDSHQIFYHNQGFRGGIDRDIAKVVSLSNGEYCWLFSADDIMKPGAIAKILQNMESNSDVYLCEQTLCSSEMVPIQEHPIFHNISSSEIFNLGNIMHRKRYFMHASNSEAFFSYLGGPIFKRTVWEKANGIPDFFYETCWGLAGRLLSLIPKGLVVHYLGESLINKRSGIDSFMDKGIVNRLRITIEGFAVISESIFGKNSMETFHIRRVTRNEAAFRFRRLISVKIIVASSSHYNGLSELNKIVFKHYSNAGIINLFKYMIYRLSPIALLKAIKFTKDFLHR
jgi:abequosyltransferase